MGEYAKSYIRNSFWFFAFMLEDLCIRGCVCVFVCVTPYLENRASGFLKHCTMSYLSDDKIFQVDKLKIYLQIIGDYCQICTKSKIFYSPALTAVVTYGLPFIHL